MSSEPAKGECFPFFRFRVAGPNQILVKTGLGVGETMLTKKTIHWPFQRICVIDLNPRNYEFSLDIMSSEMVPFRLPVVFTIGPYDPSVNPDLFATFARRMSGLTDVELNHVVAGVVHGETRVFSAAMTIRQMFADRDSFRQQVQERVQKDMNQYGLYIYNANIAEMKDRDEKNKYFENLKQKALESATTEARVQVAEARKTGDVGEAERQGEAKVTIAGINADVIAAENEKLAKVEMANMELAIVKADCHRQEEIAKAEARYAAKQRTVELQTMVERSNIDQEVEHIRAKELSKTMVEAEMGIKQAEGAAEAMRKTADAELYAETRRAEGVRILRQAQADGLRMMFDAAGHNPELVTFFMGLETNLYVDMASKTAEAVKGMQPKVNIWNTSSGGANGASEPFHGLKNLFTSLPPMLDAVQSQTDIKLPGWMPQMKVEVQKETGKEKAPTSSAAAALL